MAENWNRRSWRELIKTRDPFDNYVTEVSYEQQSADNTDRMIQLHSMTLDREKKKKSKLKKFFQKLSTKKDNGRIEFEYYGVHEQTPTSNADGMEPFVLNKSEKRRSDGTLSTHSLQDLNNTVISYNRTIRHTSFHLTPTAKRRVFNFSFLKKKSFRNRSNTSCHTITPSQDIQPSETVRALCSPDMSRRNRQGKLLRRGSDPSVYRVLPLSYSTRTDHERSSVHSDRRRSKNSSFSSSTDNESEYINFPFSKSNMQPPRKPRRSYCENKVVGHDSVSLKTSASGSLSNHTSIPDHNELIKRYSLNTKNHVDRFSSNSSDSSIFCDQVVQQKLNHSDTDVIAPPSKQEIDDDNVSNTNSLRRTPLRHTNDNYNKIVEVHKQTVDKIAAQVSSLQCDCNSLKSLDWTDFDRSEDPLQLGLVNYIVVPVKRGDDKKYSAWLQLNHYSNKHSNEVTEFDFTKATSHPNCMHVCRKIEQSNTGSNSNDGIPKTIQIDSVCLSPMIPKMTLSKYASLTLDKHTRIPEAYERETAMILLQVVKGIQHLFKNGVTLNSICSDNVFILDSGNSSITLSPKKKPNKCPAIVVGALPGMNSGTPSGNIITSLCHELAFLLYELLHCPYHDELRDAQDIAMLQATLPTLTIKSVYSRYLQHIINLLIGSSTHTIKTLRDMRLILEVVLFGPTDINENESIELITKWHNRRCIDIVTHLLQASPLIMLNFNSLSDEAASIDQEIILESEFLSDVTPQEIQRISITLNR